MTRIIGAAAAAVVLLAGCRSAVGEKRSDGDVPDEPTEGGVLRAGATTDRVPTSIFTDSSDGIDTTIGLVYDSLVDYPPERLKPRPSLARSWRMAKDGRSLRLALRDDVTFHAGRRLTSEQLVESGPAARVLTETRHEYTQRLPAAVPSPDPVPREAPSAVAV